MQTYEISKQINKKATVEKMLDSFNYLKFWRQSRYVKNWRLSMKWGNSVNSERESKRKRSNRKNNSTQSFLIRASASLSLSRALSGSHHHCAWINTRQYVACCKYTGTNGTLWSQFSRCWFLLRDCLNSYITHTKINCTLWHQNPPQCRNLHNA